MRRTRDLRTRRMHTSLSRGCRWGLLGLPSVAAALFASMTNARDGTVWAALAAQRTALRVAQRFLWAVTSCGLDAALQGDVQRQIAALAMRTTLDPVLEERAGLPEFAMWRQAQEA
jgi:hypothetical protein